MNRHSLPTNRSSSGRSSRTDPDRPGEDQKMSDHVALSTEMVESICARVDESPLPEQERTVIKATMRDYLRLGQAFIGVTVRISGDLQVPGAPIDNNAVERALKTAIRHRRNSLFYRTLHGVT